MKKLYLCKQGLLLLLCFIGLTLYSQNTVSVFQVSKDNPVSKDKGKLQFSDLQTSKLSSNVIQVFSGQKKQTIIGVGGAMTETSAAILKTLPKEKQDEIYQAYFGKSGSEYSLLRSHIGSADFSTKYYSYDEKENDFSLSNFSLSEDQSLLIPAIKKALEINPNIKFFGAPWSPPSWMKKSGERYAGGAGSFSVRDNSLREDCYGAYANYLAKYVEEYQKNGIKVWSVSVQNEIQNNPPWEGCTYSINQAIDFVGNHLGPVFKSKGIESRILIWDWDKQNDIAHGDGIEKFCFNVLKDPKAAQYIYGVGFHWYGFDLSMDIAGMPQWSLKEFPSLDYLKTRFPNKHFIATEGCEEKGAWLHSWVPAARYIYDIINDVQHNAEGWIDWNLVLTSKGGYNHDGINNPCHSPIMVDMETQDVIYNPSYYVLKQFSRNMRPGSKVVVSDLNSWTNNSSSYINQVAVQNTDGTISLFVSNSLGEPLNISVVDGNHSFQYTLDANSLTTFVYAGSSNNRNDLATAKFCYASSTEKGYNASNITDNNLGTRWASDWSDNQYVEVDLDQIQQVSSVSSLWENGSSNDYKIEYKNDQGKWLEVQYLTRYKGQSLIDIDGPMPYYKRDFDVKASEVKGKRKALNMDFFNTVNASAIRIHGINRNEKYGYSIYQVKISGLNNTNHLYRDQQIAFASGTEKDFYANTVLDNNGGSRWASDWQDNQNITIDAGKEYNFSGLSIKWENARNAEFKVQVSSDNVSYKDVAASITRDWEYTKVKLNPDQAVGRYFRIQGIKKNTNYGYSIYNLALSGFADGFSQHKAQKATPKNNSFKLHDSGFDVFPNPSVSHKVNIKLKDVQASIMIYDLVGNVVKEMSINNSSTDIDLSDLKAGVYFVKKISAVSQDVKKLVLK
ncbi:MAG: discoidin domain-containing protein [Bacteroidales bacterium]